VETERTGALEDRIFPADQLAAAGRSGANAVAFMEELRRLKAA
jgi:hypothetical protein